VIQILFYQRIALEILYHPVHLLIFSYSFIEKMIYVQSKYPQSTSTKNPNFLAISFNYYPKEINYIKEIIPVVFLKQSFFTMVTR
jgi:hypothetical protein